MADDNNSKLMAGDEMAVQPDKSSVEQFLRMENTMTKMMETLNVVTSVLGDLSSRIESVEMQQHGIQSGKGNVLRPQVAPVVHPPMTPHHLTAVRVNRRMETVDPQDAVDSSFVPASPSKADDPDLYDRLSMPGLTATKVSVIDRRRVSFRDPMSGSRAVNSSDGVSHVAFHPRVENYAADKRLRAVQPYMDRMKQIVPVRQGTTSDELVLHNLMMHLSYIDILNVMEGSGLLPYALGFIKLPVITDDNPFGFVDVSVHSYRRPCPMAYDTRGTDGHENLQMFDDALFEACAWEMKKVHVPASDITTWAVEHQLFKEMIAILAPSEILHSVVYEDDPEKTWKTFLTRTMRCDSTSQEAASAMVKRILIDRVQVGNQEFPDFISQWLRWEHALLLMLVPRTDQLRVEMAQQIFPYAPPIWGQLLSSWLMQSTNVEVGHRFTDLVLRMNNAHQQDLSVRTGSRSNPSGKVHVVSTPEPAQKGTCFAWWNTGGCKRGQTCPYVLSHTTENKGPKDTKLGKAAAQGGAPSAGGKGDNGSRPISAGDRTTHGSRTQPVMSLARFTQLAPSLGPLPTSRTQAKKQAAKICEIFQAGLQALNVSAGVGEGSAPITNSTPSTSTNSPSVASTQSSAGGQVTWAPVRRVSLLTGTQSPASSL